jgi:hypothetical protein
MRCTMHRNRSSSVRRGPMPTVKFEEYVVFLCSVAIIVFLWLT